MNLIKRSAGLGVVVVLALVGALSLAVGVFERRLAIAREDIAVLDFVDPEREYVELERDLSRFSWVSTRALNEISRQRAFIQYWQGKYGDLIEVSRAASDSEIDPDVQIVAANALFRVAQRGPQDKQALLKNLDTAVRAYAVALQSGSENPDLAFNYELAVRLRADLAGSRRKGGMGTAPTDDQQSEPNMHGDPGDPPKDLKAEQFQIRVPMDPRDIKNSQEQAAGTGQARRKRG